MTYSTVHCTRASGKTLPFRQRSGPRSRNPGAFAVAGKWWRAHCRGGSGGEKMPHKRARGRFSHFQLSAGGRPNMQIGRDSRAFLGQGGEGTREPLFLIPSWSKYNVVFLSFLYEYRIRNTSFNLLIPNIENDLAKNFNNENSKLIFRRGKSYRARLTMSLIFRNVVYQTLFLRPPIDKFSWFFLSCKIVR